MKDNATSPHLPSLDELERSRTDDALVAGTQAAESMVKEGQVLKEIGEALKGFTPEQQKRVIGAVAVMHGFADAVWRRP